jgi:hypothetical protein
MKKASPKKKSAAPAKSVAKKKPVGFKTTKVAKFKAGK